MAVGCWDDGGGGGGSRSVCGRGGGGGIGLGMEVGQVIFHRDVPHQQVAGSVSVLLTLVRCQAQTLAD